MIQQYLLFIASPYIYNNQKEVVSTCDEVICRQWIQDYLHLLSPYTTLLSAK